MSEHQHGDNDPRLGAEVYVEKYAVSAKIVGIDYQPGGDKFVVLLPGDKQVTVDPSEVSQHPDQ